MPTSSNKKRSIFKRIKIFKKNKELEITPDANNDATFVNL